ncbi:MAG: GDSL-type esterase/lipase family protein [Agrobacterium cavarae]
MLVTAGVLIAAGAVLDQSSSVVRGGIRKAAWMTLGKPLSEDQVHVQYKAVLASGMPASRFVMMGDSLTQFANWPALLNRSDILNLGLAGDTTSGMLERVKSLNISRNRVLVMGGVNDILAGVRVDDIMHNLTEIVRQLNKDGNTVFLQSTIMTRRPAANELISQLIERQRQLCKSEKCTFVDVNKSVTNGRELTEAQSVDYVHLNYDGYLLWKQAVEFIFQDEQSRLLL